MKPSHAHTALWSGEQSSFTTVLELANQLAHRLPALAELKLTSSPSPPFPSRAQALPSPQYTSSVSSRSRTVSSATSSEQSTSTCLSSLTCSRTSLATCVHSSSLLAMRAADTRDVTHSITLRPHRRGGSTTRRRTRSCSRTSREGFVSSGRKSTTRRERSLPVRLFLSSLPLSTTLC